VIFFYWLFFYLNISIIIKMREERR